MSSASKFPIDPQLLAQVRDEALMSAKRSGDGKEIALAALADQILKSYGDTAETRNLPKKRLKIGIS